LEVIDVLIDAVQVFAPPPEMTTSQWADEYRYVASGPFPGKWRTDRAPQSKEPMDASSDPDVEGLVIVKPTRSSGTEILNCHIGRRIHLDPCDILYVQFPLELARIFSNLVLIKPMFLPTAVI